MPVKGRDASFSNLRKLPLLREVQSQYRGELFIQKCQVSERNFNLSPDTIAPRISEILMEGVESRKPPPKEGKLGNSTSIFTPADDPDRLEKERALEDMMRFLGMLN